MTYNTSDTTNNKQFTHYVRILMRFLVCHLSLNVTSFVFNIILWLGIIAFCLFFNRNIRDTIIKTYALPTIEKLNLPHLSYDSLFVDDNHVLLGSNIIIYDETKQKFLEIDKIAIQPTYFFDILQGIQNITVNHITVFKHPIFESKNQSKNNQAFDIPKIPFNIKNLKINRLTLKPNLTEQKQTLNFNIEANHNFANNQIDLKVSSLDYQKAHLTTKITHRHNIIYLNGIINTPAYFINDIIGNPYFHDTIIAKINASINISDYLKNPAKAIPIHVDKFALNDNHLNLNGVLKTNLYPNALEFKKTDMHLTSGKNKLSFNGDITEKNIHGILQADNFNVVDFYPLIDDLRHLTLNGDLKINGHFKSLPNIVGTMSATAQYQNIPLSAKIIGNHDNHKSTLDLKVYAAEQFITDTHINMLNNQQGTLNIALLPQNIPESLKKNIPIAINNLKITSNFKHAQNNITFSNGHLQLEKLKPQKSISDIEVIAENLEFDFDNRLDNLNIKNATMIGIVNQQRYDIAFDTALYEYYKPKSLNLALVYQKNKTTTLNATLKHQNNLDIIHIDANNFEPDKVLAKYLPIKITNLKANFDGQTDIFASDFINKLNGHFSSNIQHHINTDNHVQASLKGTIKNGIVNGDYRFLLNQQTAGTGQITLSENFNQLQTSTDTDLKAITAFMHNTEHRLTGTLISNITMNNNRISGDVIVKNATYRNLLHGTALDAIHIQGKVSPDYIDIINLTATPLPSGSINGKGIISLSPHVQSSFNLVADDFVPMKSTLVTVKSDAHIHLKGNSNNLKLGGNIILDDLLILLPDLKTNDTPILQIIRPNEKNNTASETLPLLERVETDIAVSIKEGAKIVGFGLEGFPYGTLKYTAH